MLKKILGLGLTAALGVGVGFGVANSAANNKIKKANEANTELTTALNEEQERAEQLEEQLDTANAELAAKNSRVAELTQQVQTLNSRITAITTEYQNATARVASLTNQLEEAQSDKTELQTQLTQATARVTELLTQKTNLENQLSDANFELETLEGQVSDLSLRIANLTIQVSAFEKYNISIDQTNPVEFIWVTDLDFNTTFMVDNTVESLSLYSWQTVQLIYPANTLATLNGVEQESNMVTISGSAGQTIEVSSVITNQQEEPVIITQTSAQYFRFDNGRILGFSASGLEENLTNIVLPSSYSLGDMAERVETFDDFYDFEERAEYYNYNFSVQFEYENEEYSIRCESYSDYEELEDEARIDDGLFHLINAFEDCFSSGEVDVTFYEQTFIDGNDYSVEEIYDFAFFDTNIVSVVIPNTVTCIGEVAFGSCHSLENVVIPDSVTDISDGAFDDCESLLSIDLPFNLSYVCRAFQSTGIESICYGSRIDHIFFEEFHGCNNLSTIILLSPDVPDLVGSFDFLPRNFSGTIYVPAESLQAYRTAWVSGISNYVAGFTDDNIQAIEIDSVYESQDVRVTLYNVGILKLEDLDDLSNCSYAYYSFNENTGVVIVRYNGEQIEIQLSQDFSTFELDGELFTLVQGIDDGDSD